MVRCGRYSELHGTPEVAALAPGMDFRRPEYRREVFLRAYEFHLRHRTLPGCVYFLLPLMRDHFGWSREDAFWFAFLNGNTQNPVTSLVLATAFPAPPDQDGRDRLADFLDSHWSRLEWDTDRRYWKAKCWDAVETYEDLVRSRFASQEAFFDQPLFNTPDEHANFTHLWQAVRGPLFLGFGRLSAWSYIEYLRILGMPVQPRDLMLRDIDGSKSHRNGLCKVLGRDDLDWRDGVPPYTPDILAWLETEAQTLLADARSRPMPGVDRRDINFLTLESQLCNFKSWFRPNRRYPNVYADMLYGRIRRAERAWADTPQVLELVKLFWGWRRAALPAYLRLEDCEDDPGLSATKQNHFRETGEVILMGEEWPCFESTFPRPAAGCLL